MEIYCNWIGYHGLDMLKTCYNNIGNRMIITKINKNNIILMITNDIHTSYYNMICLFDEVKRIMNNNIIIMNEVIRIK